MKAFKFLGFSVISMTVLMATGNIASAAVYKHVDENGNVSYSDRPVDGSAKVKIHGVRDAAPTSDSEDEDGEDETTSSNNKAGADGDKTIIKYKSLEILTPKPGKVVDESGALQVIFLPTPSLADSDVLVITVDGNEISKGRDANLALSNLTTGSHTVAGKILDAKGKTKISSRSVTFQVGKDAALAQSDD